MAGITAVLRNPVLQAAIAFGVAVIPLFASSKIRDVINLNRFNRSRPSGSKFKSHFESKLCGIEFLLITAGLAISFISIVVNSSRTTAEAFPYIATILLVAVAFIVAVVPASVYAIMVESESREEIAAVRLVNFIGTMSLATMVFFMVVFSG